MTTDETPATAPIFGDYHKILRESEMIELAQDTKNRINYRFAPSYAQSDNWSKDTYDNVTDQQNMLDMDGNPIIEPEEVDLWPVRDAAVAEDIAVEWSRWRSQTAQRFQFKLDMPRNLTKVDLAKDFLATHYGGLADGGWVRERFIPFKVVDDYDAFQFIVDAIRRPASDNALCSYSEQSYIDRLAFSGTFSVPGPEWEAVSAIFRHGAPVVGSFSPTHSHLETSDGVLELVQNAVHPESEDVPGSYPLPYEWMMAVSRHFLPSLRDQRCTVIYKSGSRYSGFAGPCVRVVNEDGGNIWRGYLAQILPGYPSAQDSIAITSFCFDYGPDGRWPGTLIDGDGNRAHGAGAPNVSCFVPTDVTIPTGTSGFWEGTLQDGDEITLIACCSSPTHLFVTLNGELILFGHSTAGGPFTELESTAGRPAVLATGGIGNFPDEPDAQAGQPLRLKGWSAASMMREIEIWV
jgi:hypothetical protein